MIIKLPNHTIIPAYRCFVLLLCLCGMTQTFAQNTEPVIVVPEGTDWQLADEGKAFSLQLQAKGIKNNGFAFRIEKGKETGMVMDSSGRLSWTAPYDFVSKTEAAKNIKVLVAATNQAGETARRTLDLRVRHSNQSPKVAEVKPFYVRYGVKNTYTFDKAMVRDDDGDALVFVPNMEDLPEGATFSSQGELQWEPSLSQFKNLKEKPLSIAFSVEDQPARSQAKAKLKLEATQLDLDPIINMVPDLARVRLKENNPINMRFVLSDPNGDNDLSSFDFVTDNLSVPKKALTKKSENEYEFSWLPGYDFVKDPQDSLIVHLTFFALDKSQRKSEKSIRFTIKNTLNEEEDDLKRYTFYRSTLLKGWELTEQLREKEQSLKKAYEEARKGKKKRSLINAGLGAFTGLSPVLAKNNINLRSSITAVGGTTVLTIGTLEATEVVGQSTKDIVERLNYVIDKKNEIQAKGDIFARDFASKANRRNTDFVKKVDEFMGTMNLKGLVVLELDAGYQTKKKPSDDNIKKTFGDFLPVEE